MAGNGQEMGSRDGREQRRGSLQRRTAGLTKQPRGCIVVFSNAYDPRNRLHINQEMKKLFGKVDDSPGDGKLSLKELEKDADVFTAIRILDTAKALHDEI